MADNTVQFPEDRAELSALMDKLIPIASRIYRDAQVVWECAEGSEPWEKRIAYENSIRDRIAELMTIVN